MSGIGNLDTISKSLSEKEKKELNYLNNLINDLNNREIPEGLEKRIDAKIVFLNSINAPNKNFYKALKATKQEILKWLEKELKLVPKNYYAHLWTALGMSAFGLPIGTALFASTENSSFIAIGLPIGLGIGGLYGAFLDKKAEAEGRVLTVENV